jgi:hypothetical protein
MSGNLRLPTRRLFPEVKIGFFSFFSDLLLHFFFNVVIVCFTS